MEWINYKNFCKWCATGDEPDIMRAILNDKKRLENNLIVCNGISDEVALNALRMDSERLAKRIVRGICRQSMLARKKGLGFLNRKLDVHNFDHAKNLLAEINENIYMEDTKADANNNKNFKVREYHKYGMDKGNVKKELYFYTLEDAVAYYHSVFVYELFSLNPTIWEFRDNEWHRVNGY